MRGRVAIGLVTATLTAGVAAPPAPGVTLGGTAREPVAVWQVLGQPHRPVMAAFGHAGRFDAAQRLSSGRVASSVRMAANARGETVVAWVEDDFGPGRIMVATRAPGGRFARARPLPGRVSGQSVEVRVGPAGDAVVVWSTPGGRVQFASRPPGGEFTAHGKALGASFDIDAQGRTTFVVDVDASDETASRQHLESQTFDRDGTASPVQRVSADFSSVSGPLVRVTRAGDAYAAFGTDSGVYVAARHGSGDWTTTLVAAGDEYTDRSPSALAVHPDGTAAVAFSSESDLWVATVSSTGVAGAPVRVDRGVCCSGAALVPADEGFAVAYRRTDRSVRTAAVDAAGRVSSRRTVFATRPTTAYGRAETPGLVAGGGDPLVAWERSNGDRVDDLAAPALRAGPVRVLQSAPPFVREAPASRCHPVRSRTVASNAVARIYEDRDHQKWGCLFARGTPELLSDDVELIEFGPEALDLNGPLVGIAIKACDPEDCTNDIEVVDLRNAESGVLRSASPYPGEYDVGDVGSVRVTRQGAVGWIACKFEDCGGRKSHTSVFALGSSSDKVRRLDFGPRIQLRSLRRTGNRLSWTNGSRRRSALLR
jgi:hypothetical protein